MILKISSLVLIAFAPVAAHAVNLISNGGFDTGLAGYTVGGTNNVSAVPGAAYVASAGGTGSPTAQSNVFAAFGGANIGGTDTLTQSITTVAGKAYTLNFDYGTFGLPGQTIDLFIGGNEVNSYTASGTLDLDQLFANYSYSFTGTGGLVDITFRLVSADGDNQDALLDNLTVTAVPEAATWALMIAGFGMIGVASRRRRFVVAG